MKELDEQLTLTSRVVKKFLETDLSIIFIIVSFVVGAVALLVTPREEEPQITVPIADILISMPGATPQEVESLAAGKLEKLLMEITGVENVYLVASPGQAMLTVQFYVGQNWEESIVKLYNQLDSNKDKVPPAVRGWVVKPVQIDDVPILTLTLFSEKYSDFQLRRVAEEIEYAVQQIPAVGKTFIVGGRRRQINISLDSNRLAAYNLTPPEIAQALQGANINIPAGALLHSNEITQLEIGRYFNNADEVANLVLTVFDGRPVYLSDVAKLEDGPEEVNSYTMTGFGPAAHHAHEDLHVEEDRLYPAVTLAMAKKQGANAVWAAEEIIKMGYELKNRLIPDDVEFIISRNYGETANEKVNELVKHLFIAVVTIIVLLAIALGIREAFIVALAVPMTLAFTLIGDTLVGFTINRVTLFALILSLGLLVDDPIVDVENIFRHFKLRTYPPLRATLMAVDEVRPPTILATLAVIVSFLPLFFVTGMMGPYMAPMPFNVPLAMFMSLVVAFTVTPWATYHLLKKEYGHGEPDKPVEETGLYRFYSKTMHPLLKSNLTGGLFLLGIFLMLIGSLVLVPLGLVPLKMLPFDNKNELQLVIDMPEGTTLERTAEVTQALARYIAKQNEVVDYQVYVGDGSPFDFNGLVRHYYMRQGPHQADIRINLVEKHHRKHGSHEMALRIRNDIEEISKKYNANVKIVEAPPGPPVLATAVLEVYSSPWLSLDTFHENVKKLRGVFETTPGVKDVDDWMDADQAKIQFIIDKEKAALHGLTSAQIAQIIAMATGGHKAGILHLPRERNPLYLHLQLPLEERAYLNEIMELNVKGRDGSLIALGELVEIKETTVPKTIIHKNGRRVQFVTAEIVGVSPYKPIMEMQSKVAEMKLPPGLEPNWVGEGEWKITLDAFRDMGLAFIGALIGIYILLVIQTHSMTMPMVIMVAIPLTLIGILPGFFLLNFFFSSYVGGYYNPIFFTATGMIGMIALAGIVVRNSIILIDFIERYMREGASNLKEAIIIAGAVRFRPILLTAAAAMFGAWVIALDPIFSGLAWSFIFGIFSSTAFTLLVIPVIYHMLYKDKDFSDSADPFTKEAEEYGYTGE